jgi:hypothetical protein
MGYCYVVTVWFPADALTISGNLAPTIPVVGANFVSIHGGPESKPPRDFLQFAPSLRRTAAPYRQRGGLNSPTDRASSGSPSPRPPRTFELYSIMPQASGKALLAVLRSMLLNDCDLFATQVVISMPHKMSKPRADRKNS